MQEINSPLFTAYGNNPVASQLQSIIVEEQDRKISRLTVGTMIKHNFQENFKKAWKHLFVFAGGAGLGTAATLTGVAVGLGVALTIPVINSIALAALGAFVATLALGVVATSLFSLAKGVVEGLKGDLPPAKKDDWYAYSDSPKSPEYREIRGVTSSDKSNAYDPTVHDAEDNT